MDKKTFISKLEQALSVLQEDELRDIISEYEQHIDLKQESGLTEEEAIADFGSLDELTAEILEAYHVRADYAVSRKKRQKGMAGEKETSLILLQMKKGFTRAGTFVADGMRSTSRYLGEFLLFLREYGKRPAVWLQKVWRKGQRVHGPTEALEIDGEKGLQSDKPAVGKAVPSLVKEWQKKMGRMIHGGIRLAAGTMSFMVHAFLWAVRVIWNGFCVGAALFLGGFGLLCLFCLGMLAVLLMQHYPLAGVTLGCFGLVLCSFSAAGLFVSLIKRKKKKIEHRKRKNGDREEEEPTVSEGEMDLNQEMEAVQHG